MSNPLTLDEFNRLATDQAEAQALEWLHCRWWAQELCRHRPYESLAQLDRAAREFWHQTTPTQQREAFAAHPLIGDVETLKQRFESGAGGQRGATAHREQGQILAAEETVLERLAAGNRAYFEKHGFIFIVCASGLAPEVLLAALESRLPNATPTEQTNAAREQEKIMHLRMARAFGQETDPS